MNSPVVEEAQPQSDRTRPEQVKRKPSPLETTPVASEQEAPVFAKQPIDWVNTIFIASTHLIAVWAVLHMAFVKFSWWTVALGFVWLAACSVSITGGYHRLFSHPTYKAIAPLRLFYLLFGAASVQNSALKWSSDHRIHHTKTDTEHDPYNIMQGFWWAHIGWVLHKNPNGLQESRVKDLNADPLIRFQHRWYMPLALLMAVVIPGALGMLWGDALGAILVAGFLRLVLQWHATFSVNSVAHYIGSKPYCLKNSARDSFITAIITLGEGWHNNHHAWPRIACYAHRWWEFDITWQAIKVLRFFGLATQVDDKIPPKTAQPQ